MKTKETMEILDKISNEALQINTDKVADEILDWLIANVEYYIDNQVKMFKVDLIINGESKPPMPEARRLNSLYRHIPDDKDLVDVRNVFKSNGRIDMRKLNSSKSSNEAFNARNMLNEITQTCLFKMQHNKDKLATLYKRMEYFYEMIGFCKSGPLLRELEGAVSILKFEYEAFSVDVNVKSPIFQIKREDGTTDMVQGESKQYTIPEGFTVWVEISFSPKSKTVSLF